MIVILLGLFAADFCSIMGGYTADYLDYGIGARILAMGSAGRTIACDATTGYWNPAALPNVIDFNFSSMSTTLMGMTKYSQFAVSIPLSNSEVIAASYQGLSLTAMELHGQNGADPNANPEGYFNSGKNSLMLSYGRKLCPNSNIGITAKLADRSVFNSQDNAVAFDVGYWADAGIIQWGGNIRNAFSFVWGDTSDQYQMDADIGSSIHLNNWLFSLDLARIMRGPIAYYLGAEYSMFSLGDSFGMKLRGGINPDEISLGVGFETMPFVLDYALLIRQTSLDHIFSLGLSFDDNAKKKEQSAADKWYQKTILALDDHQFSFASRLAHEGLIEFPDHLGLQHIEKNIGFALYSLSLDSGSDHRYSYLLQNTLCLYLKQDFPKALDTVEYLVQNFQSKQAMDIRDIIEKNAGRISKYKGKNILGMDFPS